MIIKRLFVFLMFVFTSLTAVSQTKRQLQDDNEFIRVELRRMHNDNALLTNSISERSYEIDSLKTVIYGLRLEKLRFERENNILRDSIDVLILQTSVPSTPPVRQQASTQTSYRSLITPSTTKSTTTYRTRCQAITRAGHQCKRYADAGSRYCWQHP
jgi:hypothetical protein